jgi:hypothetical protein
MALEAANDKAGCLTCDYLFKDLMMPEEKCSVKIFLPRILNKNVHKFSARNSVKQFW